MQIRASVADYVDSAAMRSDAEGVVLHSRTTANIPENDDLHTSIDLQAVGSIFVFGEECIARLGGVRLVLFCKVFFRHVAGVEVRVGAGKGQEHEDTDERGEYGGIECSLPYPFCPGHNCM